MNANTRIANFINRTVTVTPTLDTNAYTANDVLFPTIELDFGNQLVSGVIKHASILDTDDQASQTITLYFAGSTFTLGTANSAISISDADAEKLLGTAAVTTSTDLIGSRFGQNTDIGLPFTVNSGSLFVAASTGGAGTHSASGLKLRVTIEVHTEN